MWKSQKNVTNRNRCDGNAYELKKWLDEFIHFSVHVHFHRLHFF